MTTTAREPVTSLPTLRMLGTVIVAALLTIAVWAALTMLTGGAATIPAAAAGATLVTGISMLSLLAIRPWKPRAIGTWAMRWYWSAAGGPSRLGISLSSW